MTPVDVIVRPWRGGWELEIDGTNVTQVRKLRDARQQVADYLMTLTPEITVLPGDVNLVPDLGPLGAEVIAARTATRLAAETQARAAAQTRKVVAELRSAHYSGSDIAELLGVSPGRVSQILSK